MASSSTKANDIEKLVQQSNYLLPDLSIRHSDLSNPSEAILTRIFIQYLKAFGFRVEPPHKVDCDVFDPSREKRLFLIRLCRQVERILQISFPNKTYTYVDIINPGEGNCLVRRLTCYLKCYPFSWQKDPEHLGISSQLFGLLQALQKECFGSRRRGR